MNDPARGSRSSRDDDFEARFGSFLDQVREGFQVIGRDWRYLYVNEAVCRQGRRRREELLGRTMMEAYPGIERTEMFAALERAMRERVHVEMENEFTYPDGSRAWFELRIQPVAEGVLVLSLDADHRKSLEAQLRHSQRMEAIGRLAGGVAHDFNNILTAIQSFGRFVFERLEETDPSHDDMSEVLKAADRAESLVKQLLAFSRKQTIEPRVLDVNELIRDIDPMLRRVLGEDVELVTRPGRKLWRVLVDPGAFEQVLLNLAVNARDAMPEGGKMTIETENAVLDEAYSMAKADVVKPGDYVSLAVTDNGSGMDPETGARLFEPFFTTKEAGKGSGLGLSTCYGIVKQAKGYIWVYSEPGRGTTFKIYLPRADGQTVHARKRTVEQASAGSETVLVVEDDPQVRSLAVRVLESRGYRVLEASNGAAGEALCLASDAPIHLLLTDVVMPEMSGRELAERLSRKLPGLRVLYMSGYTENAIVHHGVLQPGVLLLEKPFTPDRLARKVREALDA